MNLRTSWFASSLSVYFLLHRTEGISLLCLYTASATPATLMVASLMGWSTRLDMRDLESYTQLYKDIIFALCSFSRKGELFTALSSEAFRIWPWAESIIPQMKKTTNTIPPKINPSTKGISGFEVWIETNKAIKNPTASPRITPKIFTKSPVPVITLAMR